MNAIQILDVILIVFLLAFGIEFFVKLKKSENKEIETIRGPLIKRLNTIMILTVCVGILTILNIFVRG